MVVLLVFITIIVFLSIAYVRDYKLKGHRSLAISIEPKASPAVAPVIDAAAELLEKAYEPEGLFYSQSHIWAFLEINGKVKIGIDNFLRNLLGKIDKIEVPAIGDNSEQGSLTITVSNRDRHFKARIPIDGTIESVNEEVLNEPELLLRDSYQDGWLIQVKPRNFMESIHPLTCGQFAGQWIASEVKRLKEFLAESAAKESPAFQTIYDGGLQVNGVSSLMDDELWAKVKREFLGDDS